MIPYPLPDECLASYLGRLSRLNGGVQYLNRIVFNSQKLEYYSPFFGNLRKLDAFFRTNGHRCSSYRNLSLARFMEPFLSPGDAKLLKDRLASANEKSAGLLPRSARMAIAESYAVCPQCAAEDFKSQGFSYLRRHHQIRCLPMCAEHNVRLHQYCLACESPLVNDGVVDALCAGCEAPIQSQQALSPFSSSQVDAFNRIAWTIKRIFAGRIRANLDLSMFRNGTRGECLQRLINKQCLSSRLRSVYGSDLLSEIGFNPYRQPTYAWPAIYVNNGWGTPDPSMELLLAGAFSDKGPISAFWRQRRVPYTVRWHAGLPLLNGQVVKLLIRGELPRKIEKEYGLHKRFLHGVLHAYPDLERRYWVARRRQTTDRHRRSVTSYLRQDPNATKQDVRLALPGAYSHLFKFDHEWWQSNVGYRSSYGAPDRTGRRPRISRLRGQPSSASSGRFPVL